MFERFITWVKEVISKMISKSNVKETLKVDIAISSEMENAIQLWSKIYENKAPWLNDDVKSLNLGAQVATELARMITIELKTEVTGSKRADYLSEQYKKVLSELMQTVEFGNAKGGIIFKPYVKAGEINISYVHQDSFFPVAFDDSGNMTSCIFTSQLTKGSTIYTRFEYHKLENKTYSVINKAYKSTDSTMLGTPISLQSVSEWANLEEEVTIQNIDKSLFSYYKVPVANNIDTKSPLGVSVFARAVSQIKDADIQYGRLIWEYEASEKAIYADVSATKINSDGKTYMPKLNKRLFKTLDTGEDNFFKDYSPEIRDEAFLRGLNKIKQEIEFKCGLAYGTISDPQEVDKTATEIKQSKQRSYVTVSKMQASLQKALEDLIYAMDVLATLYKLAPQGKYELSFNWDDSIIVDADAERQQDRQDVAMGVMPLWEYRMKWYGETEDQAKANIPQQVDIIE